MTRPSAPPPTPAFDPGPEYWLDELARKVRDRGLTATIDTAALTLTATNPATKGDLPFGALSQPVKVVETLAGQQWAWIWAGERIPRTGRTNPTIEPFGFCFLTDYAAEAIARVLALND